MQVEGEEEFLDEQELSLSNRPEIGELSLHQLINSSNETFTTGQLSLSHLNIISAL